MEDVCVFIKYNGRWDGTLSYIGGEMKGILVPETATYGGLIELVRRAIGMRVPTNTIVMRYGVHPSMPLVRIQCDDDVKFYIQLKKKDVHVLSKFPITVDVLDDTAADVTPPEVGESNHIDGQFSRVGAQSDEAMQIADERNKKISSPITRCPQLPPHVDKLNVGGDARKSNDNSVDVSIGDHSFANNLTSQSDTVPSPDRLSGSVVVADYTPVAICRNCIFLNKKLLQYHLHHDAMSKHYQFRVKRSTATLLHVICIDIQQCPWQLRATRMRGSEMFVVKRFDDVHTCSIEIVQGHHRQAKSWMIGECVKAKYLDPTNTSYRPREIMRDMQAEFGVSFNYLRAWRGKEAALTSLRGNDSDSYNVLPSWAEMVKRKNPGSDIDIETDSSNCLECLYMCVAASKHGWPYCRPVIVVDGSALKSKFGGVLLAACGHDANGCIFPLAFGIVQSESNDSWTWFFEKLRDSIGPRDSLVIVADRHKGIEYAAKLVYPEAAFGICVQHLAANLKTKYKDFKGPLKTYFDGACRSYLLSEHHRHMESIRTRNPDMHRYLMQADPKKWSRAYFNGRRYAIMTTNIAESFNNVDRKARLMPVGFLMEWLRELQQRWFVNRREEALKLTSKLAPKAEKMLHTNFSIGLKVTPRPADQFEYAVTNNASQIWIVDMSQKTCTCRRFQVDQIPCPHAMAVCNHRRIDPYNYCSAYYTKDYLYGCYSAVVHPIGSSDGWDVPESIRSQIVNPPKTKRGPGRPRVRRILSQGEDPETVRCGRCNGYGHNRQTCTSAVPLRPRRTKPTPSL